MQIHWWYWLILGLLLVIAELTVAGGFYLVFFGVAAVVVGVLSAFHLAGPMVGQLVLFSTLSVGSLLVFRARLLRWFQFDPQRPSVDAIVGAVATVVDELSPGGVGRVELRGASWSARNATSMALLRGTRCRVVRVDGLMLHVEPEGAQS